MDGDGLTRRGFVQGSGAVAAAAFARLGAAGVLALGQAACRARDEGAAFTTLTAAEARELEAIAARILPATDTPGAREAGVAWFMDRALGSFMQSNLPFVRQGLRAFQEAIPATYPGARAFSDLDEADQDAWLAPHEGQPFFELVRLLTVAGFLGMTSYGGNRDHVGWTLLGIDPAAHTHTRPFGWYDARAARGEPDDA